MRGAAPATGWPSLFDLAKRERGLIALSKGEPFRTPPAGFVHRAPAERVRAPCTEFRVILSSARVHGSEATLSAM